MGSKPKKVQLSLLKVREEDIEKVILDYLGRVRGGFVTKIHLGGKPIKTRAGIIMVPFGNRYCRKGISDIQFNFRGRMFVFEVKTPEEHKYILKHYKKISMTPLEFFDKKKDKKNRHIKEQMIYIDGIVESGGDGDFVSSLEQVKKILNKHIKGLQ